MEIDKKIEFRLVTQFGRKVVVNVGEPVPVAGGFVGGEVGSLGT